MPKKKRLSAEDVISWIRARDEIAHSISMDLFAINYNENEKEDERISSIARQYDKFIGDLIGKLENTENTQKPTSTHGIMSKPEIDAYINAFQDGQLSGFNSLIDKMEKIERFFGEAPMDYDDRKTMWIEFLEELRTDTDDE